MEWATDRIRMLTELMMRIRAATRRGPARRNFRYLFRAVVQGASCERHAHTRRGCGKGSVVWTPEGAATVLCVVRTAREHRPVQLFAILNGGPRLSAGHLVRVNGCWQARGHGRGTGRREQRSVQLCPGPRSRRGGRWRMGRDSHPRRRR